MGILAGGALRRLFKQRREAGFPVIRSLIGAGKDRLLGDGEGNKGVLQSRTQIGAGIAVLSGGLTAFGVEIGTGDVTIWGERLYYVGIILGFILSWTGRDKAETPIAGSVVAQKSRQGQG